MIQNNVYFNKKNLHRITNKIISKQLYPFAVKFDRFV